MAISLTLSSNCLMLPGLTRTAAQPASIAAKTYFGWKWMSAITGIEDFRAIVARASASSCVGQATRTIWQPEAVSSAICWSVAPMSEVRVVVIDCTETGASPPTATLPTWIWRLLRRSASRVGTVGIPRAIAVIFCATSRLCVGGLRSPRLPPWEWEAGHHRVRPPWSYVSFTGLTMSAARTSSVKQTKTLTTT